MNEVCSSDSIIWLKYYNFRNTNNIHMNEESSILRKW